MSTVPQSIKSSLNKPISHLCPFSLGRDNHQNHCAHFVSHVMGYEWGNTCKNHTWADKQKPGKGAVIRVNEIFNKCLEKEPLSAKPAALMECLIFVTISTNMGKAGNKLVMGAQAKKHIGILYQGKVWNYSNSHDKVVADLPEVFKTKFTHAYNTPGATVEFYYGKFI